ncbi:MAG: TIGR03862 family flavoprotein [Proteobacteria bacterium]|nr:TIGR03862 family flavoprotein [Pseudomonadota bacterium]
MIAVIGAGPAGLMAAEVLARAGNSVTVYDRMPSVGRKLLMAGRGGLNLTHSEPLETLLRRYGVGAARLAPAIGDFPPTALRAWAEELGQSLFIGSSGRVFPQAMKASPLLRAWLRRLGDLGVRLALRQRWTGFGGDDARSLLFEGHEPVAAAGVVLALGGASWPRLGSDGGWTSALQDRGIAVAALEPSNCGLNIDWTEMFRQRFAGTPLKAVAFQWQGQVSRGDAVITSYGIEGGAVYTLSSAIRAAGGAEGAVPVTLDLRPDMPEPVVAEKIARVRGSDSLSTGLRRVLSLAPAAINLLREVERVPPRHPTALAALVKAVPLRVTGTQGLDRAISSSGGVCWAEVDERFMLRRLPGVFVAGEMLDWDAPTGGYLLQASLATGAAAGHGMLDWLRTG